MLFGKIDPEAWGSMSPEVAAQTCRYARDQLITGLGPIRSGVCGRFFDALATLVEDGKVRPIKVRSLGGEFLRGVIDAGSMDAPPSIRDQGVELAAFCCLEAGISPDWVSTGLGDHFCTPDHFPDMFPEGDEIPPEDIEEL
jgi:hypothetical protein